MPRFRPRLASDHPRPLGDSVVRELCAALMQPANFFVAEPLQLVWDHRPDEETHWELFHGRALDRSQTRLTRRFVSWNVYAVGPEEMPSSEALLSVKYDAAAGQLFVTRAVLCHAHESYDAGGNVIQSREVRKWQRELVSANSLDGLDSAGDLRDELACRLFQAVVGVSRLPLTSIETPLPMFALGQFGYFHRPAEAGGPLREPLELVPLLTDEGLARAEQVKLLELMIRATAAADIPALAGPLAERCSRPADSLFREVFNSISLSPYTDFVSKVLMFVRHWSGENDRACRADLLTWLVRHLARHLTAYDLVIFHHRGANYPDALVLEELWPELLSLTEEMPDLFRGGPDEPRVRLRRRAVRQAAGLIAEYAGHPVPDQPTSPGENVRVLPEPYLRVPDDQIYSPITRRRRLFAEGLPELSQLVRSCFNDLDDPEELRELGTALFLDRPFGFAKEPGEPDQTLLASHVLFSRSVAAERLRRLAGLADAKAVERWQDRLRTLPVDGLPLTHPGPPPRPGVVSLHDALRVADDFLILRTTRQTIRDLAAQFDLTPLTAQLAEVVPRAEEWRLLIPGGGEEDPTLCVFDRHLRPRLELRVDLSHGYGSRGGVEFPAAGLRVLRAWDGNGEAFDLRGMDLVLQPTR